MSLECATPGELDDAGEMMVFRRDALGHAVAAPRAFGVAILLPLVVRLAEGICEDLLAGAVVALACVLEAQGIALHEIVLRHLEQCLEAAARSACAVAAALRKRRGIAARQPLEEHRPLLVGKQAYERELGGRGAVEHHCAIASQDRGHLLGADLACLSLECELL